MRQGWSVQAIGVTGAVDGPGMAWSEVRAVLHALSGLGCRFCLEGGWGVDSLIGHQTRAHRDIDIDDACAKAALRVLGDLGYVIETGWRPNRVELVALERGWVDLHPLLLDRDGSTRQARPGWGLPHLSALVLHLWVHARDAGAVRVR
jgi:hypothetical protein